MLRPLLLIVCLRLAACNPPATLVRPTRNPVQPTSTTAPTHLAPAATPASGPGIALDDIQIDSQGLPYAWQANVLPATPYDPHLPPGPKGLPEHIEINFGVVDPQDRQPGDPILYIIRTEAYRGQWEAQGNSTISRLLSLITELTVSLPESLPTSGFPVLPVEEVSGVNDLAVQVKAIGHDDQRGFRFVGRFAQDATPVTANGLYYIYQGLTTDGKYLVTFFYPVTTSALPVHTTLPADEQERVANDLQTYLQEKAAMLNALDSAAWEPNLATLDALVLSLTLARP